MKLKDYAPPRSQASAPARTSKTINNKWLLFLFMIILAAGCKKGSEEIGSVGICPEVSSTDPSGGALNISTSAAVSAIFNEPMDPASINATTFMVKQGTTPVSGTVAYSGSTARFTPTNDFAPNTVYTATITTGVKDPAGNAMKADYVWSFNTGAVPLVVSTDPANGAIGVALNKIITATFSTSMNEATINNATFTLKQGATPVPGTI
ncbi:MAG TPA: Ig-like domain-containing protein, partial [Flavisolibacter sp.]|nr:Ig-like domain-containing protein [Flavisolibacter sp.]